MANLTAFDVIVLLLIGIGGLAGLARGFVTEVLSLLAWVAAIFAVRFAYPFAKPLAVRLTGTESGGAILAFVGIFLIAFIAFRFVAQMLGSRTRDSVVGPFDRVLGLGFGAFKGLIGAAVIYLVLGLGYDVVDGGGPRPAWLATGRTRPLLEMTSKTMIEFVEARRHRGSADTSAGAGDGKDLPADRPRPGDRGYKPTDRDALDRLLDKADGTPI